MMMAVMSWGQVVRIGVNYYFSFAQAWRNQKANETITLLKDVELDQSFLADYPRKIDLNGHNLKLSDDAKRQYLFYVRGAGNITIENGSLTNNFTGATSDNNEIQRGINSLSPGILCAYDGGEVWLSEVVLEGGVDQLYARSGGKIHTTYCRMATKTASLLNSVMVGNQGIYTSYQDTFDDYSKFACINVGAGGQASVNETTICNAQRHSAINNDGLVEINTSEVTCGVVVNQKSANMHIANTLIADKDDAVYSNPLLDNYGTLTITDSPLYPGCTQIKGKSTSSVVCNRQFATMYISSKCTDGVRPVITAYQGVGLQNDGEAQINHLGIYSLGTAIQCGEGNVNLHLADNSVIKGNEHCLVANATGRITVWDSGRFVGTMNETDGGRVVLCGGVYTENPIDYMQSGGSITSYPDGMPEYPDHVYKYKVVLDPSVFCVAIDDRMYASLEDALLEVKSGETIKLLRSVAVEDPVTITRNNVTIDMSNNTIQLYYRAGRMEESVLNVSANNFHLVNGFLGDNLAKCDVIVESTAKGAVFDDIYFHGSATAMICEGEATFSKVIFNKVTDTWVKIRGNGQVNYDRQEDDRLVINTVSADVTVNECFVLEDNAKFVLSNAQINRLTNNAMFVLKDQSQLELNSVVLGDTPCKVFSMTGTPTVNLNNTYIFVSKSETATANSNMMELAGNVTLNNTSIQDTNTMGNTLYFQNGSLKLTGEKTKIESASTAVKAVNGITEFRCGLIKGNTAISAAGLAYINVFKAYVFGKLQESNSGSIIVFGGNYNESPDKYLASDRAVRITNPYSPYPYEVYSTEDAEHYYLTIGGEEVTSLNCNDILGDGRVSYDPETETLTLNNAVIPDTDDGTSSLGLMDGYGIKIKLIGNSTVDGVTELNEAYFIGNGSLTLNDYVYVSRGMYIEDAHLIVNVPGSTYRDDPANKRAMYFDDRNNDSHLVITGKGSLEVTAKTRAIENLDRLQLGNNIAILNADVVYDSNKKMFVTTTDEDVNELEIGYVQPASYGLIIDGQTINADNLSVNFGNGGTATYNPDTHTLTLWHIDCTGNQSNNYTFLRYEGENVLTVKCYGTNTLNNARISLTGEMTLIGQGDAELILDKNDFLPYYLDNAGIFIVSSGDYNNRLNIMNLSVDISNYTYGIMGCRATDCYLTLENATLNINSTDVAAENIFELSMTGCSIVTPNVVYDSDARTFIKDNGYATANLRIVSAKQIATGITTITTASDRSYDLMGRPVTDSYRGIIIRNGKKYLAK